jgi:hypothetical protein
MDLKKIGISVGILAGSFLVILIIMYLLFPVLNPGEAEKQELAMAEEQSENQLNRISETVNSENEYSADVAPGITEDVNNDSISLAEPDVLSQNDMSIDEKRYIEQIDSLKQVVENLKKEHELELQEVTNVQFEEQVQETTKTLLSMDEDALAPIVNELEEPILIKLYNTATGMQKRKLLQSLEPEKASRILKLVM